MIRFIHNRRWPTPLALEQRIREEVGGEQRNGTLIVRWGITGPDSSNAVVLNNSQAIHLAANKKTSLIHLSEFADDCLHVPRVYNNRNQIREWPVVGRPIQHFGGFGFWLFRGPGGIDRMERRVRRRQTRKQPAEYFTSLVPVAREYRVHVFYDGVNRRRYRVIRTNEKVKVRRTGRYNEDVVRNHRNGWVFEFRHSNDPELVDVRKCARRAIRHLGLHFGAVDIGVTSSGTPYVFEVNTAPGLDDGGLRRYAEFIASQYLNIDNWRPPMTDEERSQS